MKYRESNKDKDLRKWFTNDYSRDFLRKINLINGNLRGINALDISFTYPITAIAGRNGAGKSTILALSCCAYHNKKFGFKLQKRKTTYYTFSDFFVQHIEETPPQGIEIRYFFAHNKLKKTEENPEGTGIAYQRRWKSKGGKWNDYAKRIQKNVVFLGIDRIVPHSERSQSKSYSRAFKDVPIKGWEIKVKDAVGYILGKSYDEFRYLEYSKYNLPIVKVGDTVYSGFNMGAGENALFEIFSTIYSCGDGALIVIDEVELALHSEAQRKFIDKLKDVCLETKTQVICTTHSKEIFDCLPNEARFYIESVNGNTRVTDSIASDFAFSKMGGVGAKELDIFVEDPIAKSLILSGLPSVLRSRVTVKVIGSASASAMSRQLAALYTRGEEKPILALFDGDQKNKESENLGHAKKMAEKVESDFDAWFHDHVAYFPGDTWPESWIIQKATENISNLSSLLGSDEESLSDILEYGLQAGKHNEFHEISKHIGFDSTSCVQLFTANICQHFSSDFQALVDRIENILSHHG
ncbi:AAA family ATPase [Methylobacter sp.]|uniref:ATP-dependent nuclease n=1 Tax=Methylobacter sp. TaxID=2051955 RepID=UPI0024879F4A|nr:AAA family ATPase [Methylobacter sp.]MDI1277898.1 AAA family ATPase [Methylobacter sp.]MDI1358716.1 AAA family ATPase [Methylobacter sp.]